MNKNIKKELSISSLFSQFMVGFGSGFVGIILLGIILFASWGVVGDTLSPIEEITDEFGTQISETQTHPLFLIIITLAVFLSTLLANIVYTFLSSIVQEEITRRSTALTQVFFGNLTLLFFMLPVYLAVNNEFGTEGIAVSVMLHGVFTVLFTIFILQALHQSKYLMVNLYGNLFGITLFCFVITLLGDIGVVILLFLSLPLFMGIVSFGNRVVELVYVWVYKNYGSDFLNIDTKYGEDYGVKEDTYKNDFDI